MIFTTTSFSNAAQTDFVTGADVSSLTLNESRGVNYSDAQGVDDLLHIAKRNGWKIIRLRLWVDPVDTPESRVTNLENVTGLGARIKAAGLQFMLDIHYSDTWADPGAQRKPRAWDDLLFPQLVEKVRDYTSAVIAHLRANQALPGYGANRQRNQKTACSMVAALMVLGRSPAAVSGRRHLADASALRNCCKLVCKVCDRARMATKRH